MTVRVEVHEDGGFAWFLTLERDGKAQAATVTSELIEDALVPGGYEAFIIDRLRARVLTRLRGEAKPAPIPSSNMNNRD
ncbi:MAG: hypothetical protein ACYS5V_10830 [Planctomycetota bacterium]